MSIFDHGFKRWRPPSSEDASVGTRGVGDLITNLPEAVFHVVSKNEIALDEREGSDDPVKFRMGAWPSDGTRYLGAITFDILSGDPGSPHRAEKGILAFKRSEFGTGDGGEVEVHLQRPHTDDDDNMIHVATFYSDRVELMNIGAVVTPPHAEDNGGRFFAQYGAVRLCFQAQADPASRGNLVVYDTKGTSDERQWVAIGYHKMIPL